VVNGDVYYCVQKSNSKFNFFVAMVTNHFYVCYSEVAEVNLYSSRDRNWRHVTSLTHYMKQGPSWEVNSRSASQKFSGFYWKRKFIIMFTRVRHWSLTWARRIKLSPSNPISPISILNYMYTPTCAPVFQMVSSLQVFRPKFCINFSSRHACYMIHTSRYPWLNHPNDIG